MNKNQKGEILEPVLILVGLIIIMVVYVFPHKSPGPLTSSNTTAPGTAAWGNPNINNSMYETVPKNSIYSRSVELNMGNSSYETDALEEYITLSNIGENPITITGWHLKNAKDKRPFIQNGKTVVAVADNVTIPSGTGFLSATGLNSLSPIILKTGESAIITTGYVGPRSDIPIVSFKENKCSGYLEKDADFTFTPSLYSNCTEPRNEPGVEYLDTKCQDFIDGMSSCHIPKFETKDSEGNTCNNCVDGISLSRSCIAYLKAHYNYQGCLANHGSDKDFEGKRWRVFLGNKFELWAEKRESISLFDQFGKLIDSRSY